MNRSPAGEPTTRCAPGLVWLVLLSVCGPSAAADAWVRVRSEPNDLTVLVPWRADPVRIDGDLADWDLTRPSIVIDRESTTARGRLDERAVQMPDCRVVGDCRWDGTFVYFAFRVRDRSLAPVPTGHRWQATPCHEVSDELRLLFVVPECLCSSSRAVHPVPAGPRGWYESRFRLNYYAAPVRPRPLPGRSRYVCQPAPDGYTVEVAVSAISLGFRPRAGDRLSFAVLAVDKPAGDGKHPTHFLWNVVPTTPGEGWWMPAYPKSLADSWGELRLLGPHGWAADVQPDRVAAEAGEVVTCLATVDVSPAQALRIDALALEPTVGSGKGWHTRVGMTVPAGRRTRLVGRFTMPKRPPGRYALRLRATPVGSPASAPSVGSRH